MRKVFFLILTLVISITLSAQDFNQITTDEMSNEEIILGYCNRDGLLTEPFNSWFEPEYENYEMDTETLDQISAESMENMNIKIVLGTWCSDSQREVPRFYKMMDYLDFTDFEVLAVNRAKLAEGTEVDDLYVDFVPTFIFYKNGQEIGRIIESPEESLEKDMVNILTSN